MLDYLPRILFAAAAKVFRPSDRQSLLTPSIDHLFDRGFIGFEDSGKLIVSPVAHRSSLTRMGIETERVVNVGGFTEGQQRFLRAQR